MDETATDSTPMPQPDEVSEPFFAGARQGLLMLQRCACGAYLWPVKTRCTNCWGQDVRWQAASGLATLFSYSRVHQVYHPSFAAKVPYLVCLVELDEGIRMYSMIPDDACGALHVGLRLEVNFQQATADISLPSFAPAER